MAEASPKVSVMVLNWNGKGDTLECLSSLARLDYPDYEVVVVDNGSTDGSQQEIKKGFPKVRLIENKENLGFAEGCNVGIRSTEGKYVLLLNNDMTFDPRMLMELVLVSESDDKIALSAPKLYVYGTKDVISHAGGMLRTYGTLTRGYGEKDIGQYDRKTDIDFLGVGLMRRSIFDEIGGFDKEFFIYMEDVDWCLRAKEAGYRIVFAPKAVCWHKEAAATKRMSEKARFHSEKNIVLLAFKHKFNLPEFFILDLLHFLKITATYVLTGNLPELKGAWRAKFWVLKRILFGG
ncbi:MAG: glycosyltransferase family 2 protein [Candidatus Altiarchaeota archaeon]|nr:glycosyltransferase family 2 protein [Candidatus Altiarchaeota archaeon]